MAGEDMFRQCAVVEFMAKEDMLASDLHAGLQRRCSDACVGANGVGTTDVPRSVKLVIVRLGSWPFACKISTAAF